MDHQDPAPTRRDARRGAAGLAAITLVAVVSGGWGLAHGLPYFFHVDEPHFVGVALGMVQRGSSHPMWFGNPGSTVIQPLYWAFTLWYALTADGAIGFSNPELARVIDGGGWSEYYLLGRVLNLGYYAVLPPLAWAMARRLAGAHAARVAAVLVLASPLMLAHAKIVRTDAAGAAFATLGLWRTLELLDPRARRRDWALAGLAIGLGVATRYHLLALAPGLVVAAAARVRRGEAGIRVAALELVLGLALIVVGFAAATPHFVLDLPDSLATVRHEARTEHLGADGLDFAGHLAFYATVLAGELPMSGPIPGSAVPVSWLALAGVIVLAAARPWALLVVLAFVGSMLSGICLQALHWERWIIPLVPALMALVAVPIALVARGLARWSGAGAAVELGLALGLAVIAARAQIAACGRVEARTTAPDTRVVARAWMVAHLAPGSRITGEWYTAPLAGTGFTWREVAHLPDLDLEAPSPRPARYLVASSAMIDRFRAEPARFAREVAYYDALAARASLVATFAPDGDMVVGPTIWIYDLEGARR